jgi:hypothetical protein
VTNPSNFNLNHIDGLPIPGVLPEAFGYAGEERWIYTYWSPAGDEFRIGDLGAEYDGEWWAWQSYEYHRAIRFFLAPYQFGGSDMEAEHYLVFDLQEVKAYAGPARDARRFFETLRVEKYGPPTTPVKFDLEAWESHAASILQSLREIKPLGMEEIQARMDHHAEVQEAMVKQLDQFPAHCVSCGREIKPEEGKDYQAGIHLNGCPKEEQRT